MKPHRTLKSLYSSLILLAATLSPAFGAITTVPADLNPGDKYRLVFIVDGGVTISGASSDIGVYDAVVAAEAAAVGALNSLGATWLAIGSVSGLDARDHTGTNPLVDGIGVPIYGLNGVRIVDDNNDFWDGTHDTSIKVTPNDVQGFFTAWTGSTPAGVGSPGFRLGDSFAQIGFSGRTDGEWIQSFTGGTGVTRHLYGISEELTVIPEPSTALLWMIGLTAAVFRRRRP